MNFFSWHFPLHEFFWGFFPPPHHFSNGPSLSNFHFFQLIRRQLLKFSRKLVPAWTSYDLKAISCILTPLWEIYVTGKGWGRWEKARTPGKSLGRRCAAEVWPSDKKILSTYRHDDIIPDKIHFILHPKLSNFLNLHHRISYMLFPNIQFYTAHRRPLHSFTASSSKRHHV